MADFSPLSTVRRLATGKVPAPGSMLGRFELRRMLGQGAQSVVWLAFDPRLEREVAIKIMRGSQGVDAQALAQWLQEARSVSRLKHANIVPVFEADVQDQQPYLVFEYVAGQTLAELIRKQGALPSADAARLMIDVLDALVVAHAAGVVHRDLKPSNILINAAGKAMVMDFGIAERTSGVTGAQSGTPACGTPGYMSPEAAIGATPSPTMDIFSAGIVLVEMLSGKPLIAERDPYRAIYQVMHEQLMLPADLPREVDDRLRAIAMRSLAREPAQRHASAQVFRDELTKWSAPASGSANAQAEVGGQAGSGSGTLEFLLRRMRHKTDFPAMSDSMVRIQGMAGSDKESVGSITNEILKDVALTNKLLRLVNSAHYARGSSISTVSRAVSLVGLNGIRNMALSLVLLEHMQDKVHANLLKGEFLRSLMAGSIAGELCPSARDAEEAFIGSMFQNLGRLLAEFYFPEEAATVRAQTMARQSPVNEAVASASVLGLSYEDLGIGVAKVWGLPVAIQRCMRKPPGEPPGRVAEDGAERMRWIAMAANASADALLHSPPKELDARLAGVVTRFARTLGVSPKEMHNATAVARQKLVEMAHAMDLKVVPGSAAARLLKVPDAIAALDAAGSTSTHQPDASDTLAPLALHATQSMGLTELAPAATDKAVNVAEILTAGIQDITNAMVEDVRLSDLLRMIIETMYRAMSLQRIVFCMRDVKTDALTGRFGLGADVDNLVSSFKIALQTAQPDLFTAVCNKGADTMISDATEARMVARLPAWYRQAVNAPTFLLLPLQIKGKSFGLIYADKATPGDLVLDEKELALLRTLRNQAIMAFKQSS
ncbi:protein kinase domain-containing protein [Rhodoferax sp.]|uniref:protein kinase domain-containing protein n=1 Tax=Rhodoferax sp. TaxID=50421 RepID=UPI00276C2CCB|nr:HDOD domain-containing protein [Rhodoferax sp.]